MRKLKYSVIVGLYFATFISAIGARTDYITIEAGTPLFKDSTINEKRHRPLITRNTLRKVPVLAQKTYRSPTHPLIRKHQIKQVKLPDNQILWVSQQMRYVIDDQGKGSYVFLSFPWYLPLAVFFLFLFFITGYLLLKRSQSSKWLKRDYLVTASIVFLHYGMLMLLLHTAGVTIFSPSDEFGYFEAAKGINHWDFSGQWRYTIGLALFYIPFIRILGAKSFTDIETAFSFFNALVLTPGYLVLGYFVVKKMSKKFYFGLISVLLFQFFMFFHQYRDFYYKGEYTCKSFFSVVTSDWSYYLHSKFLLFGYNAGSENISMLLILCCIAICLYSSAQIRNLIIVSAIFALACLTRLNNIFFAPLLLWLFWNQFGGKLLNIKYLLKFLALGVVSFLIAFSPQLIINKIQFGSFFTFPYVLHAPDVYKGFILSCVPSGFQFLSRVTWAYLVPGSIAMLFIRDRKIQLTMIFWTMPLFFFFCGYPALGAGSTRFIMITYFAFSTSIVLADFWTETNRNSKLVLIAIMAMGLLCTTPSNYQLDFLLPWGWDNNPWGHQAATILKYAVPAISALLALMLHNQPRALGFAVFFILLFFSGTAWLLAPLMVGLLIYAVIYFAMEIVRKFSTQSQKISTPQ